MYTTIGNSWLENVNKTAVNSYTDVKRTNIKNDEPTKIKTMNRDYFEYIELDEATPSQSIQSSNSATNTATTDTQRRNIPYMLAAKRAGLNWTSSGSPIINSSSDFQAYQKQMNLIRTLNYTVPNSRNGNYYYSQTGNNYGYDNATTSCATYALATALSIKNNRAITPDMISTNSSTDGQGTLWSDHSAYEYSASESETLLAIDAQLCLGNPVLIHTTGLNSDNQSSEHWATVVGKDNGTYKIIDPYYGDYRDLDDMQIYKNSGQIVGYAIISNQF